MCPPAGFQGVTPSERTTGGEPEALRIRLLGGFSVSVGSRALEKSAWRLRKAAALVKLLALSAGHRLHREQAMEALWPELGKQAASNNLRRTLHTARRVFDPAEGSRYLASEDDLLMLCPEGQLWVDVETFEQTAATARRAQDPAVYRVALELYAGDLLPADRYEGWTEEKRVELRQLYLDLLIELARAYEERSDLGRAVDALRVAVGKEPTLEEAHVGMMRLYSLSGREGEALVQYQRLRETLSKQLGTEPSTATRRLYEDIAAGRFPTTPTQPAGPAREEARSTSKHNLPAPRTSFVGREREMLEVKRGLAMTRLLTLTGAGGSGKTRLALEVARGLVGAYPDGVWLVELAPISEGALVPQTVAEALGVQEQPSRPLTDTLVDYLRDRHTQLVVDNCEHLVEAVARLVDILLDSCSRLRVLATSREALGVAGEVRWTVPALSVPDLERSPTVAELEGSESARLFVERASERHPHFMIEPGNARSVTTICRRLEGIPLAIELAAARVGTLSLEQISQRLGSSLELLTRGGRTTVPRQRTLKGALDWSHDLLSEPERILFRRLSVFAGGWTLEAAEAVVSGEGVEEAEVLDLLSGLVEKSLVVAEPTPEGRVRHRLLEPLRQYALAKLEQSGEVEARKRPHAEHFLALVEGAEPELIGPRETQWLERLEEEHDNIRAAFSWTMERGEAELGLRLAGALRMFWIAQRYIGEGRRWIEEALAKGGGASARVRVKVLGAASALAMWQDDLDQGKAASEEGLRLSAETGVGGGHDVAFFLIMLGFASLYRGDSEQATKLVEESLALSREANDAQGIVAPHLHILGMDILGMASSIRGDHEQAKDFYKQGVAFSRELGSAWMLSQCLNNSGWTSLIEGDLEQATALFEEAAELAREVGDRVELEKPLCRLGWVALLRGDVERAKALHKESLVLCRERGYKQGAADNLEGLACSAGAEGEAARAARLFGAAQALREAIGIPLTPASRTLEEPYLLGARSQLEEATWEAAFAEGLDMRLEEAVEYALTEQEFTTPEAPVQKQVSFDQPPTLTRREREVASLVVQGLPNRQIAEELFVSERTVENHVAKILKKLDLRSREQVASRLRER